MQNFFRAIQEKWRNWSGDRDLERSIRRHLDASGYFGATAKLQNVRLAAVQRPGWLQVFRFEVVARKRNESADDLPDTPAVYRQLYGLVREDARHDVSTVRTFESTDDRRVGFADWSIDMIQLRGGRSIAE